MQAIFCPRLDVKRGNLFLCRSEGPSSSKYNSAMEPDNSLFQTVRLT